MLKAIRSRLLQGYRTGKFPDAPPNLPERFCGLLSLDPSKCAADCRVCCDECPTDALKKDSAGKIAVDLGRCIFCGDCVENCRSGALTATREYRMAAFAAEELKLDPSAEFTPRVVRNAAVPKLCGKSLKIRQVSCGGCNACELDFNVLNTLAWDMGRFGIQAVASPRHADVLLVTGPVTANMLIALKKSYAAMPEPRFVIACGACAASGGIYRDGAETNGGLDGVLPVDMYVPGCPPHPAVLLDALLRFMGRRRS